MQANIELARDVEGAKHAGAEGIGLLRTEFMFLNRSSAPTEEEQYQTLKTIVTEMSGRPVTVRTFDLVTKIYLNQKTFEQVILLTRYSACAQLGFL